MTITPPGCRDSENTRAHAHTGSLAVAACRHPTGRPPPPSQRQVLSPPLLCCHPAARPQSLQLPLPGPCGQPAASRGGLPLRTSPRPPLAGHQPAPHLPFREPENRCPPAPPRSTQPTANLILRKQMVPTSLLNLPWLPTAPTQAVVRALPGTPVTGRPTAPGSRLSSPLLL